MTVETWMFVVMVLFTAVPFAGASVMIFVYAVQSLLRRLGLRVFIMSKMDEEATGDEDATESRDEDKGEDQSNGTSDDNKPCADEVQSPERRAVHDSRNIISGQCMSCGFVHIGLTPARILDKRNADGYYDIPRGTPAVCPRCWVKINPDMVTNTMPMPSQDGDKLTAEEKAFEEKSFGPNKAFNHAGLDMSGKNTQAPQPGDKDDNRKKSSEAPQPTIRCDRCLSTTGPFRALHPIQLQGASDGRFWCQACVDFLGSPQSQQKRPKRRREE